MILFRQWLHLCLGIMYSKQFLPSSLWILVTLNVAVNGQKFNSTEECRPDISKGIHPVCTIQADQFSVRCISEGVMYLLVTGSGPNENRTIFCSAPYPIRIVLNFREKSLLDVTLDFPEFERTVENISRPDTFIYHIRIPHGFITRANSEVKSFTIMSVNSTSNSTSFVNHIHDFMRRKELEMSQSKKRVIPVTQELINLPCPIYESGKYPEGVHRIHQNSSGGSTKKNLFDMIPGDRNTRPDEIEDLKNAFHLNNIPVDNKRLLWDPINGFRFNISNWPGKDYLGSYFCTTGERNDILKTKSFKLIDFKVPFVEANYDEIYITTIARTVNISFECVSTKEITFLSSFKHGLLNGATITKVKCPESIRNTTFYLVYLLNINTWGNDNDTVDGIVRCIVNDSQNTVRTWRVVVRDIRLQDSSQSTQKNLFPFWVGSAAAKARCNSYDLANGRSVKYLTCRNAMECEMIKFCIRDDAFCPNIVTLKQCSTFGGCNNFKAPDNGILNCQLNTHTVSDNMTVTYFKGFDGLIYADWMDAPISSLIRFEKNMMGRQKLYSKDWLTMSCKGHRMLTGGLIQWILHFKDNSSNHIQERNSSDVTVKAENLLDGIKSTLSISLTSPDIVGITCKVPIWNSDEWLDKYEELYIVEPTIPKIKTNETYKHFKIGSKDQSISCEAESDPDSNLTWAKLDSNFTDNFSVSGKIKFASLQFRDFSASDVGDYICTATNIAGKDSKIFHVGIDKGKSLFWWYTALGTLLILLCIGVIVILWIRRNLQIARRADVEAQIKEAADKFRNGYEADDDSNADKYPYNNEFEIPMEDLTIDRTKVLGSGAFGIVFRGRMEGRSGTVAVKTLQQMPRYNVEFFQSLISELKLLIFIGKHPNVVELVGAITHKIHSGEFYIVSEECVIGSLQTYLRSKRHQSESTCETSVKYLDLTTDDWKIAQEKELLEYLMKWSYQIADAMEFIAAKNVIHADLATRNILLAAGYDAKISDFGLSRKLYHYAQYVKKKKEPLPWAWMSIEALRDLTFSTKSDVWSYGVVLWEMYSFAAVPYGGMNYDTGFVQKLKDGLRLPKPELATDSIYDVMQICWSNEPKDRLDFSDLKRSLESIKESFEISVPQENNSDTVDARNSVTETRV